MSKDTTERLEITVTFTADIEYGPTRRGHWVKNPGAKWPEKHEEFVYDELTAAEVRKEGIERLKRNFTDPYNGMAIGSYGGDASFTIVQTGRDKPKVNAINVISRKVDA